MLTMSGTLRAALQTGGAVNKKTGEAIPIKHVIQLEGLDDRGLVQLVTLTVPDSAPFAGRLGQEVGVPVKAAFAAAAAPNVLLAVAASASSISV